MAAILKTADFRPRRLSGLAILALLFFAASPINAAAQSTDRDNPEPLASSEIRGSGVGKKVEYYYTFLAGPGEVILTIDSGAKGSFSQFEAELFDFEAEKLAKIWTLPYPGETARKVTRVSFGAEQPVLMRLMVDRDAAQYLVRVAGAAKFSGADASFSGATDTTAATDADPSANTDGATASPAAGKATGLKKFWLRLSKVGEVLGLAAAGLLHVEMKDGTAQDIGLGNLKRVSVGEATAAPSDGSNITPSGEDKLTGWQRQWLKLGAAGELTSLSGRPFRLEMKDGTVQEFNASKVKKISIKK
jgi:hypothetical protein